MSFAAQPQELDGAGCPQAKPEGRGHRGWLFAYFLAKKVGRLAGRDPPSVDKTKAGY